MSERSVSRIQRIILISSIVVTVVVLDQITKSIARDTLRNAGIVRIVGDFFVFRYAENSGAFLSLGASWPPVVRAIVFGALSGLVVIAAVVYVAVDATLTVGQIVGLSLLIGGGVGNLIDRVTRQGSVVDFMNIGYGRLRTGIFNVADLMLISGGIVFLVVSARKRRPGELDAE